MREENLKRLIVDGLAFDTETHIFQPGLDAPPIVCGSSAQFSSTGDLFVDIHTADEIVDLVVSAIRDPSRIYIGANIAFDFAVICARRPDLIPAVFDLYRNERVFDVLIAEQLHAIAQGHLGKDEQRRPLVNRETGKRGGYSLDNVLELVTGQTDAKANDTWRKRYHELEATPMAEWPAEARQYPKDDARNTWAIGVKQSTTRRNLHDMATQAYTAWCLKLAGTWGVRTDPVATEALAAAAQAGRDRTTDHFKALGFLRDDGTEDGGAVKRAVAVAYGCKGMCLTCNGEGRIFKSGKQGQRLKSGSKGCAECSGTGLDLSTANVPRTDKGAVQTGRDQLVESGDDVLVEYAQSMEDDKVLDTYIPFLRQGYEVPITLGANILLRTGRTSYRGVIQLLPRSVSPHLREEIRKRGIPVMGVRDCIVPRPNHMFYSNDYAGGELVTHAESCVNLVGFSKMGEALIRGEDVHSSLGAEMMGITYAQFLEMRKDPHHKARAKAFRQAAKALNFGLPGGMGPAKLVLQQRMQGPDTVWPVGTSQVWDDDTGSFVPGYKGLRFCVLVGGAERCSIEKVTSWNERSIPPTCLACIKCAVNLRESWRAKWPENKPYFQYVAAELDEKGEIVQHYSRRVRGFSDNDDDGSPFTSAANSYFQAYLADIAKRAQCRVSWEQYCDKGSVLYGSRSLVFLHDELLGEAHESVAAEVSERVNEIMVEEFRKGCPHHAAACKAEPTLMRRWYKAAECVRDGNGRLLPWEPKR